MLPLLFQVTTKDAYIVTTWEVLREKCLRVLTNAHGNVQFDRPELIHIFWTWDTKMKGGTRKRGLDPFVIIFQGKEREID